MSENPQAYLWVNNILSSRKGGDNQGGRLLTGIVESFAGRR